MTQHPLRLVADHAGRSTPASVELPPSGAAAFQLHLHIGALAPDGVVPTSATPAQPAAGGHAGKGRWRPWFLGTAGVVLAVVAFDLGARSGEGHARAIAAQANTNGLAARLSSQQALLAAPTAEIPLAIRQQLAQPPTVTPRTAG